MMVDQIYPNYTSALKTQSSSGPILPNITQDESPMEKRLQGQRYKNNEEEEGIQQEECIFLQSYKKF